MANYKSAITLRAVTKYYTDSGNELKIFDKVDAEFNAGEFSLILGRSGSGKSTLLNIITGVDVPSSGKVFFGDICVSELTEDERTLNRRGNVGIVFQFFYLIPTLSVLENIILPMELNGINSKQSRERAYYLLEKVYLKDKADRFPDTLSGGEQQRAAIARAIAHKPKIIIADEPTGNLDSDNRNQIIEMLLNLVKKEARTVIMATHGDDITDMCDCAYYIRDCRLDKIK